ncbi:MAG TPA: hypothetical protein VJX66_28965 [Amycolatopsis sp.]|nr:hypothetical protein [Amycolatopsis sp.]
MIRTYTERAADINERVQRARADVAAALEGIDQSEGTGSREQYEALVGARRRIAAAYRAARGLDLHTDLDETLWFALDEAALWQDKEAERYRRPTSIP